MFTRQTASEFRGLLIGIAELAVLIAVCAMSKGSRADVVAPAPATAPASPATAPVRKVAVPTAAEQKNAAKLVDGIYKDELAKARTPEQRQGLARTWLKAASETHDDPAGRYVLLTRARDLATDLGDSATALSAAMELQGSFQTDTGAADAELAGKLGRTVRSPGDARTLAIYLNGAVNELIAADRFDIARRLADLAVPVAARSGDAALAKLTAGRPREVHDVEVASKQAGRAQSDLARDPQSPKANLELGRLYGLMKGDWQTGLQLLSLGADPALKSLAERDRREPEPAEEQRALADGWWDLSERAQPQQQPLAKAQLQLRARKWYADAAPNLSGLARAKAEQRVKETGLLAAVYGPKHVEAAGAGSSGGIELPQGQFVREWKTPPAWANKPELVTVKGNKITVLNEGGRNTVYADADLVRDADGTLTVTWHQDASHGGYEVWSGAGRDITISRWDSKADKDAGKPPRRVGYVVVK